MIKLLLTDEFYGKVMDKISDSSYLKHDQYHSAVNLNNRITLHEKFSTNPIGWSEWIFDHLKINSQQRVLAVGCGNAMQWRDNASKFPQSAHFTLMDLSVGMLDDARQGLQKYDQQYNVLSGDAQFLPYPNAHFDWVTANAMLYHVPNIAQAIAQCARVLKPDGIFMASTNGENHMIDFYALLSDFDPNYSVRERGFRRFGLENGRKFLARSFEEVHRVIYDCDLWVTDPQALANYAFSMWDVQDTITMVRFDAMCDFFGARIRKDGGIRIRKDSGLFLASHSKGLIDSLGILKAE